MSGIVRTAQQLKIGPKRKLCSALCVSLLWRTQLPRFLALKPPARAEWLRGQAFWPSTFWRIGVYNRPFRQKYTFNALYQTSSLTFPLDAASLSGDSAVLCFTWATGLITLASMRDIDYNISLPTIIRLLLGFGCPLFKIRARKFP
ncbi:hypothetical protein B0H19DRAFT_1241332 [Mycena capillaripes]|nr:hypothetical protein B0H19DRAFT_1241332 [Mycena capillaripes]